MFIILFRLYIVTFDCDTISRVKPSWAEQVEQGDDAGMLWMLSAVKVCDCVYCVNTLSVLPLSMIDVVWPLMLQSPSLLLLSGMLFSIRLFAHFVWWQCRFTEQSYSS